MADFTFKTGDTSPAVTDTLSYSDGSPVNLEGATVKFQMRSLSTTAPLSLTGNTAITSNQGGVSFTPTAADTAVPGSYMANWVITFVSGEVMTFPTTGYLWGLIEPNLATLSQQLVSLPDLKEYLNFPASDRSRDSKLLRYVSAVTPLVENVVGPVVTRNFEEWHTGGQASIQLRRRPSSSLGTTPVFTLGAVDEYRGATKYSLSIVAEPDLATSYSVMFDPKLGTVTRRTTGGGVSAFATGGMPSGVHVSYTAGQQTVPANVTEAALEAIRVNYQTTQATGRGSMTVADGTDIGPPLGFFLPRRCLELLAPNRRHPAIA